MGLPVLILGESGTGKSASMRNFKDDEVAVINVAGKPLPFKNKIRSLNSDSYTKIKAYINDLVNDGYKTIVIDDAQYLMANEFMRRATERGYDKFTEIAQNFWLLINSIKEIPSNIIVYLMAHIERDPSGNEKIKTIGKMLDEKITVEGMFTIVLKTNVTDGQYGFITQNSGHDTVKSPIGMFPSFVIDNDLKYVDEKIRNYYEIGDFLSDGEIAKIDEEVKREDLPVQDAKKTRRSRHGKAEEEKPENTSEEKEEAPAETPKRKRRGVKAESELPFTIDDAPKADADPILNMFGPDEEAPKSEETSTTEETPRRRRRRS